MHWIAIVGIGIAANLDNLGIGLSYGINATRISFSSNAIMSIIAMAWAFIALTSGEYMHELFKTPLMNNLGGILLVCVGLINIILGILENKPDSHITKMFQKPELVDIDGNRIISWKESITLGMVLAINCIGTGFGAGASGIHPYWTTLSIGLFSFISVDLGVRSGLKLGQSWLAKGSNMIAGLILIIIGIYEILS